MSLLVDGIIVVCFVIGALVLIAIGIFMCWCVYISVRPQEKPHEPCPYFRHSINCNCVHCRGQCNCKDGVLCA